MVPIETNTLAHERVPVASNQLGRSRVDLIVPEGQEHVQKEEAIGTWDAVVSQEDWLLSNKTAQKII
jgi:hypothetical protein